MVKKRRTFADQLRRAIEKSGLTQYQICQETGIDKATLSRFMNGKGGLSIEAIELLFNLFGLQVMPED